MRATLQVFFSIYLFLIFFRRLHRPAQTLCVNAQGLWRQLWKFFFVWLRKLRKVWVGRPKPITIVRVGSGRPRPILPRGLGQSTQNDCKVWVGLPKPAAKFGSNDPNRLQYLGRATQTGCNIWVERPKPTANRLQALGGTTQTTASFGSSDPNRLQYLGRTTQTGCKLWVVPPKPAAIFGSSNIKVQMIFIYLNSYMVFKDPECPTYIINIIHHNSFDGNYFGVICIVYSCNTICISL